MMRFNAVVLASLLLLGGVAGCNQGESNEAVITTPKPPPGRQKKPEPATPNATVTATPAAGKTPVASPSPAADKTPVAPAAAKTPAKNDGAKPTLTKLNGYLPAAVKALQANNVNQAKQYAQGFTANWQQKIIQYKVKTESQAAFDKLSAAVNQVNSTVIQPPNPDKTKAIASLQSLSQAVTEYTKSP
jgi:hypothetical protein